MSVSLVIPARHGSTRFPGKPLARIKGQTMLARVVDIARQAVSDIPDATIIVATEDERIADHARELQVQCALTSQECKTGTDRVYQTVKLLKITSEFIINFQGDAPFTPPHVIRSLIEDFLSGDKNKVITPVHQLSWKGLDQLRKSKKSTPFTGTTVVMNKNNEAIWFSKNILPAMRNESDLRQKTALTPVWQHIGLYGYPRQILKDFIILPSSYYEELEGLEQLRLLENGHRIKCVPVQVDSEMIHSGIDSPEDIKSAERYLPD